MVFQIQIFPSKYKVTFACILTYAKQDKKYNINFYFKITFAPNLAKKISTNFYYLSLLFQLSVAYSENFKEIRAWEVLKFF